VIDRLLIMHGILLHPSFTLLQQLYTVDNGSFLHGWCKHLFVSELSNKYFTKQILLNVLHGSSLQLLLEYCDFLNTDIPQGSVATYLRCVGIFKYDFVANLSLSLPVKEL